MRKIDEEKMPGSVTVEMFFADNRKTLNLLWIAGKNGGDREIREASIHRPGLALTGFLDYFADKRIQIIGSAENAFLASLTGDARKKSVRRLFGKNFPCVIFTRGIKPPKVFSDFCDRNRIPLFSSSMVSYNLINGIIIYLDKVFSPSVKVIGDLVDVNGTGVLIRGPSGIGKSECALALIRRGSALVSDDIVKVNRYSSSVLVGSPPSEVLQGFMEIRGLGLINIIQMFGISSFRHQREIDLVITMKPWDSMGRIDRTGLECETYRILGVNLPHITIPVAPGRETANLVEVASQEMQMRKVGIHSGKELNDALIKKIRK